MRVLREDFNWDGYRLHFLKAQLGKITHRVTPTQAVKAVDDPDDDRILECAVTAGSEYVVTNDNALLRIGEYAGIKIVNLSRFLELGPEQ